MTTAFVVQALLLAVRLLPLLVVMPVAVFARVPLLVRTLMSLVFAAVLASAIPPDPSLSLSLPALAFEFLTGMIMAFGLHVTVAAFDMMGRLIDLQVGFNASGVFDPATSNAVGIVSEFLSIGVLLLFMVLDLHHVLLRGVSYLVMLVPPGQSPMELVSPEMASMITRQFLGAFMLASPVIIGLWLTDAAFAFMSRSMPQANIYFLAIPVKVGVGLLLLVLTLPVLVQGMSVLFRQGMDPLATEGVQP